MLWTERFPGRLEHELQEYGRRGLDGFRLDEEELARGRVVVAGVTTVEGDEIALKVVYPDLFPYFRPDVFAHGLSLGRHQNPFDMNLCLLEASTRAWNSSETGAWLVAERVPYLLGLLRAGEEELIANEVPQGEPVSYYIPRHEGTAVFMSEEMTALPEAAQSGPAYFSFQNERVGSALHILLRQVNADRRAGGSSLLATSNDELRTRFNGPSIEGRWLRLEAPPGRDPQAYFAANAEHGLPAPPWQRAGTDEVAVLGAVFKEEVRQGVWEDNWIFAINFRSANGSGGSYLTKSEHVGPRDLMARVPRLAGLADKRVALAGLGSLGAPLALELARAQLGDLRVLDGDLVEGGTIVRWPVGLPAVGTTKAQIIQVSIANQYPYTECVGFNRRLGEAREVPVGERDDEVVGRFLDDIDLVIDATAEIAVQHVLSDLATEADTAQLYVWGTEGAYGGVVARVLPGETGCWLCLQYAIEDGSIVAPPFQADGSTQPRGCGQRTFTGEGFNLLPLVSQATRVAVMTLLGELAPGRDVFVMSLRDGDEAAGAPAWMTYPLEPHPRCPRCAGT